MPDRAGRSAAGVRAGRSHWPPPVRRSPPAPVPFAAVPFAAVPFAAVPFAAVPRAPVPALILARGRYQGRSPKTAVRRRELLGPSAGVPAARGARRAEVPALPGLAAPRALAGGPGAGGAGAAAAAG